MEEPYQVFFVIVNTFAMLIYYGIGMLIPFIQSKFVHEEPAISDDFFKDCSLIQLYREYLNSETIISEVKEELKLPF
jgi:hypothetical protein